MDSVGSPYDTFDEALVRKLVEEHNRYVEQRTKEEVGAMLVGGGGAVEEGEVFVVKQIEKPKWHEARDDFSNDGESSEIFDGMTMQSNWSRLLQNG